jgi:hypothetical protein
LRTCDNSKSNQLWAAMPNRNKFEIRPYDQRNLSVNDARCLSQLHHPKRECNSLQTEYHIRKMIAELTTSLLSYPQRQK